jgi:uncharacterized protein (DUF2164 family)
MAIELSKPETDNIVHSLRQYFKEELDQELSEMRAKILLGYIMKEIAPIAYNQGVKDAETYMMMKVKDLSANCYEAEMTYWKKKQK